MLDTNDLYAIRAIVEEVTHISENLILKEVDRVQDNITKKIEKIQHNVNELNQYYKINKLENENTTLLLRLIEDLSKRVTESENCSA